MSQPHISIENALIEYYKLKDKYDDKYDSKKMSIISDESLTISKRKIKLHALMQPENVLYVEQRVELYLPTIMGY